MFCCFNRRRYYGCELLDLSREFKYQFSNKNSMDSMGKVEKMRILKSPQLRFDEQRFLFEFDGELITVSFDGVTDTFDFTGLPDGEIDSSMVETVLEHNPIIRAKREAGVLSVEIMNFISEDATEEEKFPEWEEY